MRNNYICALDLGSSKIACSLAKLNRKDSIEDLFLGSLSCKGIKRGRIVDIQGVSNSIDQLLKIMKAKSNINIRSLYINVYGQDVIAKHSRAVIPLAEKRNKLITPSDMRRVNEEARILGSNLEEDIVQAMPFIYSVDDQDGIINPLGLYGHKLGVDLFIISVKTTYLQGINRILNRLGYEIKHLFLSGLATSKIILDEGLLKNGLYVFCDIGADLTEIVIFEDAILKHIETLSLGGSDLTEEIAQTFKIPFELSEEIKQSYARITDLSQIKEDKEVMIKKDDYYKAISQNKICEVITYKAKHIFCVIKEKLDSLIAKDKAINTIFVGGRTVLIDGFLEMMETTSGFPVKMAANCRSSMFSGKRLDILSSTPQFLKYATSLGVLYEAIELSKGNRITNILYPKNIILKTFNRIKEIYQEYF